VELTQPPRRVSTGALPALDELERLIREAHTRYAQIDDGALSSVYPALARVDPGLFGLCLVGVAGRQVEAGDTDVPFTIMSVAKPFTFALVCDAVGPGEAGRRIGVNATGLPFNAVEAVARARDGRTNPMVNPGAIASVALVPGTSAEERWAVLRDGLSRFAGRELALDDEVFASASATNHRNRELVAALVEAGALDGDPAVALDLYTRQSSLSVTAADLALMGATLANGGVNPRTGVRVVSEESCHHTLVVMTTAGLYETSGEWLYEIGLPGKSGIGGGIVTVAPGKGALATFSPLLDGAGNSIRGVRAASFLSRALGLDLFASRAAAPVSEPERS
jgi:glutaminase